MTRRLAALCVALALSALPASAAGQKKPKSFVGIQGLLAIGVHSDIAGRQYGVGGGPLLQFTFVPTSRLQIHVEGIPVVGIPQRPSAFYGAAIPSLGVVNASMRFAVDTKAHWWVGFGTTIINQKTPLPNIFQVASSRLAGGRYEAFVQIPLRNGRFFEGLVGVAPRLYGTDRFIYSDGSPAINKDERAAEEDLSVAYGIEHAHSALLFGLRSINFSAVFTRTGLAADRNNGAGVTVELRRFVGP